MTPLEFLFLVLALVMGGIIALIYWQDASAKQ